MPAFSIEAAKELAATPLGTSAAAAIVAACLYFIFMCLAVISWLWTKYSWHDVLVISTACTFSTVTLLQLFSYLSPAVVVYCLTHLLQMRSQNSRARKQGSIHVSRCNYGKVLSYYSWHHTSLCPANSSFSSAAFTVFV